MSLTTNDGPARSKIEILLPVQGYDIDVGGIVNNIVYVRWLENLRQAWCDIHYPTEQMVAEGFIPALGSTHIEYKRAIRFGDKVVGRIWFEGFQGVRWNFGFEILANERTSASAKQRGIFITLAEKKIYRIPPEMIERFG